MITLKIRIVLHKLEYYRAKNYSICLKLRVPPFFPRRLKLRFSFHYGHNQLIKPQNRNISFNIEHNLVFS